MGRSSSVIIPSVDRTYTFKLRSIVCFYAKDINVLIQQLNCVYMRMYMPQFLFNYYVLGCFGVSIIWLLEGRIKSEQHAYYYSNDYIIIRSDVISSEIQLKYKGEDLYPGWNYFKVWVCVIFHDLSDLGSWWVTPILVFVQTTRLASYIIPG